MHGIPRIFKQINHLQMQIERGLKSPTFTIILRLTQALGCSAGQLVSHVEKQLKK